MNGVLQASLIIIAILTFILPNLDVRVKLTIFVVIASIFVVVAVLSVPTFYLDIKSVGTKPIDLADRDAIIADLPLVGLIGLHSSGKTSMLNALRAEQAVPSATETATINVIGLPNSGNPVGLVDSVGSVIENQFEVVDASKLLIFFVDHNEKLHRRLSAQRLSSHMSFASELIARQNYQNRSPLDVILVLNKSDIWLESAAEMRVRSTLAEVSSELRASGRFNVLAELIPHSNKNVVDISRLMSELERGLDNADS